MKEVCARFAGFDKDIPGELNMDAFMEQAAAYVRHIEDGPANSIMEFMPPARLSDDDSARRRYSFHALPIA